MKKPSRKTLKLKADKNAQVKIAYYEMRANQCNDVDSDEQRIEKAFWLAQAEELR